MAPSVRTGGSRHTGQAASPHRNIQVVTPNFDDHLLKSLNLLGNYNVFSANNVLDNVALSKKTDMIQIMHVHGTYQFYDCCNLESEITKIANENDLKSASRILGEFLKDSAPIIIGYSGWEDDVIMTEIKERLQYALPYQWFWFCYTQKDYENLPKWLKEEENILFVIPEAQTGNTAGDLFEEEVLPAEDVFSALITKFNFSAPILFSNPLQYYIELADQFLPQNSEVFPIKSWKRRLDYIEQQLGDIDKKIIELDESAARKNIVDATNVLESIDFRFVVQNDLEHIYDAIVLPLMANKNRIENREDLYKFYDIVLDIMQKRKADFDIDSLIRYLDEILGVVYFRDDVEKSTYYLDIIVGLCGDDKMLEVLKLMTLGMKSELVDATQAIALQDVIIEQGREKLDNKKIARLVLIATIRQAVFKRIVSEEQRMLINEIYIRHTQDKSILETYYYQVLRLISEEIECDTGIEKVINEVKNHELSKELLLYAYFVKYQKEESEEIKIEIAREGIDGVEIDSIKQCRVCLSYSEMLSYIIEKKARSEQHIETKYINLALELCEKEERCKLVCSSVIWALTAYVFTIKSEYEKKGISEKLINVCEKCESWEEWAWICEEYVNTLEDGEREEFISKKKEYQTYLVATNDMSLGIEAYTQHDIEKCKIYLLNAYKKYETLFGEEYNPATINIAFLVRRNEMPEIKEEVFEILNKIKWMNGVAVYHINKALAFVEQEDWEKAVNEIGKIDSSVEEALEWWLEEGRVDEKEKCEVILLLVFGNILSFSDLEEHEIIACKQYMEKEYVPDNIKIYFEKMSAEEIEQ